MIFFLFFVRYFYFEQGKWKISTTDPRYEIPQIFLTSSRNIPMSNFNKGDNQSWEIGPKGLQELELSESDNKIVDVSIKRGEVSSILTLFLLLFVLIMLFVFFFFFFSSIDSRVKIPQNCRATPYCGKSYRVKVERSDERMG